MTTQELKTLFERVGTVVDAKVLSDRETGRSRGFGFVTMSSEAEAAEAIQSFNGYLLSGRILVVNEATERQPGGNRPYTPRVNSAPIQNTESVPLDENRNKNHGKRRRRSRDEDWDQD